VSVYGNASAMFARHSASANPTSTYKEALINARG